MRRIMVASLASGFWLSGTGIGFAECQTFAQARAANPDSYLAYRVVAGAHCWYVGHPGHRAAAAGEKPRTPQPVVSSVASSSASKPVGLPPTQEPMTFRKIDELNTPVARVHRVLYGVQSDESFNTAATGTNSLQEEQSSDTAVRPADDGVVGIRPEQPRELLLPMQDPMTFRKMYELNTPGALADRILYGVQNGESFNTAAADTNSLHAKPSNDVAARPAEYGLVGIRPEQPRERGPPVGSERDYLKFVIWVLLTIGFGLIGCGIFDRYAKRSALALKRLINHSWRSVLRVCRSARTRLIDFIADREPRGPSAVRPQNARDRETLMDWPISAVRPDEFPQSARTVVDEPRVGGLLDDIEQLRRLTLTA